MAFEYGFKQIAGYTRTSGKDWEKELAAYRTGLSPANPAGALLLTKRGDDALATRSEEIQKMRELVRIEYIQKTQKLVDDCVYYRNLAIKLGAKPEQMTNEFDRKLCQTGIDDKPDGYTITMAEVMEEYKDAWGQVDKLEAQNKALNAELRQKVDIEQIKLQMEVEGLKACLLEIIDEASIDTSHGEAEPRVVTLARSAIK